MKYGKILQKEKNIFYLCGSRKITERRMDMKNGLRETYQTPHVECIAMNMESQFLQASTGGGQGQPGGGTPDMPINEG